MKKAILKTNEGLIQLYECPKCNYMVMQNDIIWEKPPVDINDTGIINCCKFCSKSIPDQLEDKRHYSINEELKCLKCGAPTRYFKWSIMGQIKMGLCDTHKHYEPYLSFGPKGIFDHASMGVEAPNQALQLSGGRSRQERQAKPKASTK